MEQTAPTVYIETYGCQMNVSDSELMLGKLAAAGYEHVSSGVRSGPGSRTSSPQSSALS